MEIPIYLEMIFYLLNSNKESSSLQAIQSELYKFPDTEKRTYFDLIGEKGLFRGSC